MHVELAYLQLQSALHYDLPNLSDDSSRNPSMLLIYV